MSGAPFKFSFSAVFSSDLLNAIYDLKDLRIVTEQSHVLNCRISGFCVLSV